MTNRLSQFAFDPDVAWIHHHNLPQVSKAMAEAMGVSLRRCRQQRQWTRGQVVAMMPSGIGDRTLLAYERGWRSLTTARWVELCTVLGVLPGRLLDYALQEARLALESATLRVDLAALIATKKRDMAPLKEWARNRVKTVTDGVAELHPSAVNELAVAFGYASGRDLAERLAVYLPTSPLPAHVEDEVADPTEDRVDVAADSPTVDPADGRAEHRAEEEDLIPLDDRGPDVSGSTMDAH